MSSTNGAFWILDGNFEGDCNINCIDRGRVWCPDNDHKTGACFEKTKDIKDKVRARGSGKYSLCSS
jgi:hypothetical protein